MKFLSRSTKTEVSLPTKPVEYPKGTCVKTESGTYYIGIEFKKPILTDRIRDSWGFARVVETTDAAISKYLKGTPLGFRSGTVIYDFSTGKTYVIWGESKRHLTNPDRVEDYGMKYREDVLWVSAEEAALHSEGKPIN